VTDSVVLGRSAKAVLDAFAKLQRKAGDTLRYEDIFHCLGDAQVARIGQRELICKGLAIEHQYSLELTPAGYCGSACKKDPLSGVIGVQKGPLISMV
jgi:hypothetical protein